MQEIFGDFWQFAEQFKKEGDLLLFITTNGAVKNNGAGVMGAGIAKEAAKRHPWMPAQLGYKLTTGGNHVHALGHGFWSFPVKHHWSERADIELIERSAKELMETLHADQHALIGRPGCGNGKLHWDDVKKVLDAIFDDRVFVIHK